MSRFFFIIPLIILGSSFLIILACVRVLPSSLRKNPKHITFDDVYFSNWMYNLCLCSNGYGFRISTSFIAESAKKRRIILLELFGEQNKCLLTHKKRRKEKNEDLFRILIDFIMFDYLDGKEDSLNILAKFISSSPFRTYTFLEYIDSLNPGVTLPNEIIAFATSLKASKYFKINVLEVIGNSQNIIGMKIQEVDKIFKSHVNKILDSPNISAEEITSLVFNNSNPYLRKVIINHPKCPRLIAISGALLETK